MRIYTDKNSWCTTPEGIQIHSGLKHPAYFGTERLKDGKYLPHDLLMGKNVYYGGECESLGRTVYIWTVEDA